MKDTIEIQIFLSSPKDVAPEKDEIKKIIESKNRVQREGGLKYRFTALDYRDLVYSVDGNIQTVINRRLNDYDIYLGILWKRFGTKTGNRDPHTGHPYESGTEEEFFIAKRKIEEGLLLNSFFFFKEVSNLTGFDPQVLEQLHKVWAFRTTVKTLGSVNSIDFDDQISTFINNIHEVLDLTLINIDKIRHAEIKEEFIRDSEIKSGSVEFAIAKFIKRKPVTLSTSVPRTISPFFNSDLDYRIFQDSSPVRTLASEITEQPYILLLGNAGSGKSIELSKLAEHYADEQSTLVPVFQRMNTYVDEPIEEFLPVDWRDIPEEITLVILDGLDEVAPEYFNTAIKRILNFKKRYPKIKIVISCRTNFYDFQPDGTGPLSDFSIYFLDEMKSGSLNDYLKETYQISAEGFRREIREKGYQDLLTQPFFLNILADAFKTDQVLPANKTDILNGFIDQRLSFDEQHFKLSRDLGKKKSHIFWLLKRLALVMEDLGRNYLTTEELESVLTDPKDVELVKCSTAFQKMISENDKWGFEHNNIQEFLAASAIATLDVEKIKMFLSFDGHKIKPSWINTLFFLISIVPDATKTELINWIISSDVEIMAKIEPDRVDAITRMEIFKSIFISYKERKIWLRSNKFSNKELANFPPVAPANEFLLAEISDKNASQMSRLNAVDLLMYQKLDAIQQVRTKEILISLIGELQQDVYAFNAIANALAILNVASEDDISNLMEQFGDRNNQYVRAGMYQIITHAGLTDKYIDYLISGIGLDEDFADREKTNLIDESLLLENALRGELNIESVIKLLQFFSNPTDRRLLTYYSKNEVYMRLMDLSTKYFGENPQLLEIIYKNFIAFGKYHDDGLAKISDTFFKSTGTRIDVLKKLLEEQDLDDYHLAILSRHLLEIDIVDYLMAEFKQHNLTRKDIKKIYEGLNWHYTEENRTVLAYFKEALLKVEILTNDEAEFHQTEKIKNSIKADIDVYFSVAKVRQAFDKFFIAKEIDEINWDKLWEIRKDGYGAKEPISEFIFHILEDFTRGGGVVTKLQMEQFWDNSVKAERYLFENLKNKLKSQPDFMLEQYQIDQLTDWVNQELKQSDIPNAISVSGEQRNRFSYDRVVTTCWYFISRFNLPVDKNKLLDYTLFDEPNSNLDVSLNFRVITDQIDKDKVDARVISNLKGALQVDSVWANNALYAIANNLTDAKDVILKELANPVRSLYTRSHVMKRYLEQTGDYLGVYEILDPLGQDEISWEIAEQFLNKGIMPKEVANKLLPVLDVAHLDAEKKLKVSRLLTRLGNDRGTSIYLDYILTQKSAEFDFYSQSLIMRSIRNPVFIPKLMELLQLSQDVDQPEDAFNRLDRLVTDALYNIALSSEPNLQAVKTALKQFINDNESHSKSPAFYHTIIDKMDYDFYLSQSSKGNIDDSIKRVDGINILP